MTIKRLPKNSRTDPVRSGWVIERSLKTDLEKYAATAGISASAFVEQTIKHLKTELDDRGVPAWLPRKDATGDELPIDSP